MKRGRPKGYCPYIEISYEELGDWVGRKTKVPVSKKWLETLMGTEPKDFNLDNDIEISDNDIESKIEYTLTQFDNE